MNDDIKEIFAYFKRYMSIKDCSKVAKIEDYITNLQQKNERLEKQLEYLRSDEYLNQVKWERNFNETMNKELKSRIEKAVEYMGKNKKISLDDTTSIINFYNNLLEILNGRSNE